MALCIKVYKLLYNKSDDDDDARIQFQKEEEETKRKKKIIKGSPSSRVCLFFFLNFSLE